MRDETLVNKILMLWGKIVENHLDIIIDEKYHTRSISENLLLQDEFQKVIDEIIENCYFYISNDKLIAIDTKERNIMFTINGRILGDVYQGTNLYFRSFILNIDGKSYYHKVDLGYVRSFNLHYTRDITCLYVINEDSLTKYDDVGNLIWKTLLISQYRQTTQGLYFNYTHNRLSYSDPEDLLVVSNSFKLDYYYSDSGALYYSKEWAVRNVKKYHEKNHRISSFLLRLRANCKAILHIS